MTNLESPISSLDQPPFAPPRERRPTAPRLEPDDCTTASALHDLAALCEGTLTAHGKRRLAAHLRECWRCQCAAAALAVDLGEGGWTGPRAAHPPDRSAPPAPLRAKAPRTARVRAASSGRWRTRDAA
jgi:hypothetical protein